MRNAIGIALAAAVAVIAWADPQDPLIRAIELPEKAEELREAGLTAPDVRETLRVIQTREIPPQEAVQILEEAGEKAREHGPVDNFGAFVRAQLDEGLRGQELAKAIAAEHAARGKGPPEGKGPEGRGAPDDKGPPEGKGAPEGKGRPDASTGRGAPDGKGAPDRRGRPTDGDEAGEEPAKSAPRPEAPSERPAKEKTR